MTYVIFLTKETSMPFSFIGKIKNRHTPNNCCTYKFNILAKNTCRCRLKLELFINHFFLLNLF